MVSALTINILKLYGFIAGGFVVGLLFKKQKDKISKIVTWLTINIFTPVVIFLTFTTTEYSISGISIVQILLLEVASVFTFWLTTYYGLRNHIDDKKKLGSFMFLNALPNVLIYGIPIVLAFYSESLIIILVVFTSAALVVRGTVGMYIGEKLGADVNLSIKDTIKRLLTFPPLLGIIAGFIGMNLIESTDALVFTKDLISPLYSGLGASLIGLILTKLKFSEIKAHIKDISIVALWRYGISFIFYIAVVWFLTFPVDQTEIRTILLIAVIGPPAVMNVSFAVYFGLDEKFAAISVATITLISLMLLPLEIMFGTAVF